MTQIAALLKTCIYLISSSLLYPVLFLLVLLAALILIAAGSFFAELMERIRLRKTPGPLGPDLFEGRKTPAMFSHRSRRYLTRLRQMLDSASSSELAIEHLLQEYTHHIWKPLDMLRIMVRLGPSLGLIGTLIPMGTGLAAMSQGDLGKLSADLVIAFTTTVVGLAIGMVAFVFFTIQKRWVEEDIRHIEFATEILAGQRRSE